MTRKRTVRRPVCKHIGELLPIHMPGVGVDTQRYIHRCRDCGSNVRFGSAAAMLAEQCRAERYAADAARIARGEPIDEATLPQKEDR